MSAPEARRRIDQVLDAEFVEDLDQLELDELRSRRRLAGEVENELSYYRRLLHGRIDLLRFEQRRRRGDEDRSLIEALPQILADSGPVSGPGRGRHLITDLPPLPDVGQRDVDQVLSPDVLSRLDELDDDALAEAIAAVKEVEQEVSEQRRQVQEVEDRLTEAVSERYRSATGSS